MKLEDRLNTLAQSATTSLSILIEWLKTKKLYNSYIKDFESTFEDFIEDLYDEIENPAPTASILRDDYSDIDDVFNDNFDISFQFDKLFDNTEEEQGPAKAEKRIEALSEEYTELKNQFESNLIQLKEFMLVITEDLS